MDYRIYIYIITQLATRKFVVLPLGRDQIVCRIEEGEGGWRISLKLSSLQLTKCSRQIQECFAIRQRVNFFHGTDLVINHTEGPGVYLVKTTSSIQQYSPLKQFIEEMIEEVDDFKQLFSIT